MVTVVYGGSASGKSEYAESIAVSYRPLKLYYIATMNPYDEESRKKVGRHRQMRSSKNFETIECYTDVSKIKVKAHSVILLECMSNLVANEIFSDEGAKDKTLESVKKGINHLISASAHLIIVTNNIFDDGNDYDDATKNYLAVLAGVNCYISEAADNVIEVVHGIAVNIKGKQEINKA